MKFLKDGETKQCVEMLKTWGSKEEFDAFTKEFKSIKTAKNKQIRVGLLSNPEYNGTLMVSANSKRNGSLAFVKEDSTLNNNMENLDADLSAKTPLEGVIKTLKSMRDTINQKIADKT